MTHTFDSEVSLHSWLLWPMVRRQQQQPQIVCRRRRGGSGGHYALGKSIVSIDDDIDTTALVGYCCV